MITALDAANDFIMRANEHLEDAGDSITNLKLQKLLYYASGIHLALYDCELFPEPITAWQHGPVVVSVYRAKKRHEFRQLPTPDGFDGASLPEATRSFLDRIFDEYGQYSAEKLRDLTHNESPWITTTRDETITPLKLKAFFRRRVQGGAIGPPTHASVVGQLRNNGPQTKPDLRSWGDPEDSASEDAEIMQEFSKLRALANRDLD